MSMDTKRNECNINEVTYKHTALWSINSFHSYSQGDKQFIMLAPVFESMNHQNILKS